MCGLIQDDWIHKKFPNLSGVFYLLNQFPRLLGSHRYNLQTWKIQVKTCYLIYCFRFLTAKNQIRTEYVILCLRPNYQKCNDQIIKSLSILNSTSFLLMNFIWFITTTYKTETLRFQEILHTLKKLTNKFTKICEQVKELVFCNPISRPQLRLKKTLWILPVMWIFNFKMWKWCIDFIA